MKRVIRYSSFILALGIMFSACYYMSYRSALGKLRRMESRQDMDALFDEKKARGRISLFRRWRHRHPTLWARRRTLLRQGRLRPSAFLPQQGLLRKLLIL